jgi:hypothetical protein
MEIVYRHQTRAALIDLAAGAGAAGSYSAFLPAPLAGFAAAGPNGQYSFQVAL